MITHHSGLNSSGRAGRRAVALAAIAGFAVAMASPVEARGSFRLQQPRSSSEPVNRLPEPVRQQVASVCRNGAAQHGFASYSPDRIVLHYEHLHCSDRPPQCGAGGCLHQVYSFEHGGWHLVKSYHGNE